MADLNYAGNENPRQMVDVYLPEGMEKPMPVVLWIHGGAWRQGSKENAGMSKKLAQLKMAAVVSVGYRLTDEAQWPAQIHDCKAAVRFVRANADKYGLDPERILVWGSSAGGHLAAMLGVTNGEAAYEGVVGPYREESSKVKAVVNFFGPADLVMMDEQGSAMNHSAADSPEGRLVGGKISENLEKAKAASPLYQVGPGDPPMLVVHGTEDRLVPYQQSVDLDAAYEKAGCDCVLLTVKGGGHGAGFGPSVEKVVGAFFEKHLARENGLLRDHTVGKGQ
ncbi:MAG: alpha/beta fold hydrolase [Verrucomicrobiaceae bacterium]